MRKLKKWLFERILPVWARSELMAENERLRHKVDELELELQLKDKYIDGLLVGVRAQRRIIINASEVKK